MKVLHILSKDESLAPLSALFQQYDVTNEHHFITTIPMSVVMKQFPSLLGIRGISFAPSPKRATSFCRMQYIKKRAIGADHIVWHSFSGGDGVYLKLLYKHPELLKKSTWVVSNNEIDNLNQIGRKVLKEKSQETVRHYVLDHLWGIIVSLPCDEISLRNYGITNKRVLAIPSPLPTERLELLQRFANTTVCKIGRDNNQLLIQMGLNTQIRNHFPQMLAVMNTMFNKKRSLIFIPEKYGMQGMEMATGSDQYKSLEIKLAKEAGIRSFAIRNQVPHAAFCHYIDSLDAVFLGNTKSCNQEFLLYLLSRGKRVFMLQDSPVREYLNKCGANIHALEDLKKQPTERITDFSPSILPNELTQYYQGYNIAAKWIRWFKDAEGATNE